MGCKLSIGIKGDTNGPVDIRKVVPISHEQSTSPIKLESKDISVSTHIEKESVSTNTSPVHKNPKSPREETISPDSPDSNGAESEHKHSSNRLKNKTRQLKLIQRGLRSTSN